MKRTPYLWFLAAAIVAFSIKGAAQPEQSLTVSGEVEAIVEDRTDGTSRTVYRLNADGRQYELRLPEGAAPVRCGQQVIVRGRSAGDILEVSEISSASHDALPVCVTTGEQKTAVILVSYPGVPLPAAVTPSWVRSAIFGAANSVNSNWREASFGTTGLSGDVYGPFLLDRVYSCQQELTALRDAAIGAADSSVDFSQIRRILIVRPYTSDCGFAIGNGDLGCRQAVSPTKGAFNASTSWVTIAADNVKYVLPGAMHEMGHNLGLHHNGAVSYAGQPLGPLSSAGTFDEYLDHTGSMGGYSCTPQDSCTAGLYVAPHRLKLGWLDTAEVQTVTQSGTFVLKPYASPTRGLRALRLRRPGTGQQIWVEYRQLTGSDASLSVLGSSAFAGAWIHRTDGPGLAGSDKTELLDFHPSTPDNFRDASLLAGESWKDPYSTLALRVNSADANGLEISVTQPGENCTYTVGPGTSVTAPASGVGAMITVVAPSGCAWTATSPVSWIGIAYGPSGGIGDGFASLTIQANATGQVRSANVAVAGKSITVTQQAAGPTLCVIAPSITSADVPAAGGSVSINIFAGANCPWGATISITDSWIQQTAVTNGGTGEGTLTLSISPNTSASSRQGIFTMAGRSFTIRQAAAAAAPAGMRFVPITPCRVSDTRVVQYTGTFGPPSLAAGSQRDIPIPQGICGLPSSATAYSLNVTVVPKGPLSYLTLWPTGSARPLVSTLNSFDGRVKANAAIVPAGTNGAISVFVTDATDVILDINGYFVPATAANVNTTYSFTSVSPCRVADTRLANGTNGGPSMAGGTTRTFSLRTSACGSFANAVAYSLNITAIPKGGGLGYLAVFPAGTPRPLVSTLNSYTGTVVANAAIVLSGTNGDISVFVTNDADVIIDVNGYFSSSTVNSMRFYPVAPCRMSDSRNAAGAFGGPILGAGQSRAYAPTATPCGVAASASAYVLNATVVPSAALSYLTVWPAGSGRPLVSTLNSFDGSITANALIVPAGTGGGISSFVTDSTHLILDISGYFAP